MKRKAPFVIGIDLGGTQIKAVAVARDGRVLQRRMRETQGRPNQLAECIDVIRQMILRFETAQGQKAMHMGLATPGMIERSSRRVAWCPGKLEGIEGLDWTAALGRSRLVPLINDAHAALLGEHWVGAARAFRYVVLLTLGTGVGGAVLEDGKLVRGARGWAGLLGYTSLGPYGPKSFFNVPNPLEEWIGDRTVSARSDGRFLDTQELLAAVRAGDEDAHSIWQKSIRALAVAVASFGLIFDPEAVVIGGGIARAGVVLFKPLAEELNEVEWRPGSQRMKILHARLGEWAGAIGAARNAMDFYRKPRR